ncbi:hypothetical protein D3C71_1964960 [compost metagenome]
MFCSSWVRRSASSFSCGSEWFSRRPEFSALTKASDSTSRSGRICSRLGPCVPSATAALRARSGRYSPAA